MQKITFEDKISLDEKSDIDIKNKITAEDMNSIKAVINEVIETEISNQIKADNMKRYYVGSLIFDTKNINPATYLGFGTWQLWGSGCVPVGIDTTQLEFNTAEKTGGQKSHSLTIQEMPKHKHLIYQDPWGTGGRSAVTTSYSEAGGTSIARLAASGVSNLAPYSGDNAIGLVNADYTGEGSAHSNLQPYITCYIWKRTA